MKMASLFRFFVSVSILLFVANACTRGTLKPAEEPPSTAAQSGGGEAAAAPQEQAMSQEQLAREGMMSAEEALKTIYFDFDKSDIREDQRETLKQNAEWLKTNSGVVIQIEGHCDERGTNEYNLALGQRRADSTKNFLVSLGISAERILTITYGEEKPVDPGHDETAWAKNRRAQFVTVKAG